MKIKKEYASIVIVNFLFALYTNFFFRNNLDCTSLKIYGTSFTTVSVWLLCWFLYGGSLCLILRWEKIAVQGWKRAFLIAARVGITVVLARLVLDNIVALVVVTGWSRIKMVRLFGLATDIFGMLLINILFRIFIRGKRKWSEWSHIPLIGILLGSAVYTCVFVYESGVDVGHWTPRYNYLERTRITLNGWIYAFFAIMFWWMMRTLRVEKEVENDSCLVSIIRNFFSNDGEVVDDEESIERMKKRRKRIKEISVSGPVILLIVLVLYFFCQPIHIPTSMTYPYDVTIESGHATINAYLSEEKEISFPKRILWAKVTGISEDVFDHLPEDVDILDIPMGIHIVGEYDFQTIYHKESKCYYFISGEHDPDCVSLAEYAGDKEKAEIPEEVWGRKVTGIFTDAFASDVEEVVLPETITFIMPTTFEGCKSLKRITLPPQLSSIGTMAFAESGIERIELPEGVDIDSYAFAFSALEEVIGIENVEDIGSYAFQGTPWEANQTEDFVCIGDSLYLYCGSDEEVVIPETVKHIRGAFTVEDNCTYPIKVKKVFIPDSVISISAYSFSGQEGAEIYIPDKVSVGMDAERLARFGCAELEQNEIIVTTMGSRAEAYAKKMGISYRIITREEMRQELENAKNRQSNSDCIKQEVVAENPEENKSVE